METTNFDLSRYYAGGDEGPVGISIEIVDVLKRDDVKSKAEGREIVKSSTVIRKYISRNEITEVPFSEDSFREPEYGRHIRAAHELYLRRKEDPSVEGIVGTPIARLPGLSAERVMELRLSKVFTIEQLAGTSDTNVERLGLKGRDERREAQIFLASAKDTALAQTLASDKEFLTEQVKDLQAEIAELRKAQGKRKGE